ncbi:uncharacterized protein AB675_3273 [Cyphellophora attinorum]|uniref:Uncharacterized protein n=1 Tax=Cyphellophora attinorum TaxID=1664694 RepID=A0A0N0NLR8_9EURO|nr:uncharacterized protein AB675_3273 [Phialophora attinorum]KPI39621.1 hypothetical protein AB675_3273 [Phialophora attinorum]
MPYVSLKVERDGEGTIKVSQHDQKGDLGQVEVVPAEGAQEGNRKRKLEEESQGGANEYETVEVVVRIQVKRQQPATSAPLKSDAKRQKTELDAKAPDHHEQNGARSTDANINANMLLAGDWRAVYESFYKRVKKRIDDAVKQSCPNDHKYFKSYATPLSEVLPDINRPSEEARTHRGTRRGAYALDKAEEAVAAIFTHVVTSKVGWHTPIKSATKLDMSSSGLDITGLNKIDAALAKLTRTRLLCYPLTCTEVDGDQVDIRKVVEYWHNDLDRINNSLVGVFTVRPQLFPQSWKVLHDVWGVRDELDPLCYRCEELEEELKDAKEALKQADRSSYSRGQLYMDLYPDDDSDDYY